MSSNQPSNKRSNDNSRCRNEQMKRRKLSVSDSPSKTASNSRGINDIWNRCRSVVNHPFSLMLVWAVETMESGNGSDKFNDLMEEMFPDCRKSIDNIHNLRDDTGFYQCYTNWCGSEPDLTQSLADTMNKTNIVTNSELEVLHDTHTLQSHGRTDIRITSKQDTRPLMVIEVGLDNKDWWKKYDQASRYMRPLVCGYPSKSPVLLTVLTIPSKEEEPFEARLGMFLFVPRLSDSSDYRVILIWRKQYSGLDHWSTSLGRLSKSINTVLAAASLLSKLWDTEKMENYKILGPNCCKIDDKVLRAYDNRLLNTERRPDIYLEGVPNVVDKAEVLCDLYDGNLNESRFGLKNDDDEERMWQFKGRLLVISMHFYEGRHWAQSPTDFVPIIEQLQRLHEFDYVHGDIRGSNMVLNNEHFDFDFSGKFGKTLTYPAGYHQELFDGLRRGEEDKPITKYDDWYALIEFIFSFHSLKQTQTELDIDLLVRKDNLRSTFEEYSKDKHPNLSELPKNLLNFLRDINEQAWKVRPVSRYRDNLIKYGCMKGSDSLIKEHDPSKIASGSPQKLD